VPWFLRQSFVSDAYWIAELRADVLEADLRRLGRYDPDRVRRRFCDAFDPDCTQVIVIDDDHDDDDAGFITVREAANSKWIEHFNSAWPPTLRSRAAQAEPWICVSVRGGAQ